MEAIPKWDEIAVVIMVAALAAYSVTWIVKAAARQKEDSSPWWLRAVSVLSGAGAGMAVGGWPWGLVAGFGAGSLTTALVGVIKRRLKAKAEKLES